MRRYAAVAVLLGTMSGCFNLDTGPETGGMRPLQGQGFGPPSVPGVQGPYGQPVPMASPYNTTRPGNEYAARAMMRNSVPLDMVGGMNGMLAPPGFPPMPGMQGGPGAPPGGPAGPTIPMGPGSTMGNAPPSEIMQAQFAMNPAMAGLHPAGQRTQVRFLRPIGMQVSWYAQGPDGKAIYSPTPIDTPGKYNFLQGARYRLKLTNLPGRPGVELYPTLEVIPGGPKTDAFLAHNNVPVEFTDEDFKQIADGNYLVKVVYLPDPQFQDVAGTGTAEIISTPLEPGQDPIQEALRRGSILLVIRMGNIDQEAPNTPPLSSPGPMGAPLGMPGGMPFGPTMPGMMTPPLQVPYWGMGPGGPAGAAPHGVPPGMLPPGTMPPGMVPPGMMPPGMFPPGAGGPAGPFQSNIPNVAVPPSGPNVAPGTGPAVPSPLTPAAPTSKFSVPGLDPLSKAPSTPAVAAPVTPISVPPSVDPFGGTGPTPLTPALPPLRSGDAGSVTDPIRPSLPPSIIPGLPR